MGSIARRWAATVAGGVLGLLVWFSGTPAGPGGPAIEPAWLAGPSAARADDDGDDGDDGYGGGGGYGGAGGRGGSGGGRAASGGDRLNIGERVRPRANTPPPGLRWLQRRLRGETSRRPPSARRTAPQQRATPPAPAPLPVRVEGELVAMDLTEEAIAALAADGYAVVERFGLAALGQNVMRLSVPAGTTLEDARDAVAALAPLATVDFNGIYAPEGGARTDAAAPPCAGPACAQLDLVGWPAAAIAARGCDAPLVLGMVDTGINPEHAAFADARLELVALPGQARPRSDARHGSAVAALLVGGGDPRIRGLVPRARLLAVDPFAADAAGRTRTAAFELVLALDRMADLRPSVVNLSLAGPPNALLARAVAGLDALSVALVAAVGNDGPAAGARYPAALPEVVGVTAVDRNRTVWRRATRGDHVALAAPGVAVWSATSIRGARPRTGTSFAAPFVTAALALERAARPFDPPGAAAHRLARRAQDLGEAGRDPVFGHGLLDASDLCRGPNAPSSRAGLGTGR